LFSTFIFSIGCCLDVPESVCLGNAADVVKASVDEGEADDVVDLCNLGVISEAPRY